MTPRVMLLAIIRALAWSALVAAATLKGGADIVLASYDPDIAFEVIAIIVARARTDAALRAALETSDRRLAHQTP